MEKEFKEDEFWLKTKINEFKMLNNTLVQLVENGAKEETINDVKGAINDTLNDINDTRREIELEEEENTFSYYDSLQKEENKCGDVLAYSQVESSRFLTNLDKVLGIPKEFVQTISFDLMGKHLSICINDFIADVNGVKTPVMNTLMDALEKEEEFNFSINHYSEVLKDLYTEKYYKCKIQEIYRDPINVKDINEYPKIQIFISYQGVKYEATD